VGTAAESGSASTAARVTACGWWPLGGCSKRHHGPRRQGDGWSRARPAPVQTGAARGVEACHGCAHALSHVLGGSLCRRALGAGGGGRARPSPPSLGGLPQPPPSRFVVARCLPRPPSTWKEAGPWAGAFVRPTGCQSPRLDFP